MQKAKIQVIVWKSQKNIIPPMVLVEVIEFIVHKYWLLHILRNLERNSLNQFAKKILLEDACLQLHVCSSFINISKIYLTALLLILCSNTSNCKSVPRKA